MQIQCILQIVANRLSFMTFKRSRKLRLTVFYIMTFITVTGSCTWVPGSLQLSPTIAFVGSLWDRCNKAVFSAVDLCLNVVFLRMVWCKLVSTGLTKYKLLFRLNTCMVFLSVSLDVSSAARPDGGDLVLTGESRSFSSASSPRRTTQCEFGRPPNRELNSCLDELGADADGSHLQYLIFNPMVFSIKLYIELNLAEMIAYIARSSHPLRHGTAAAEERADMDQYAEAAMIVDKDRSDPRCRSSSETAFARHAQEPPVALHTVSPWADSLRPEVPPAVGLAIGRPSKAISPQCR